MELLKAVNTILPYLGEHVITRIETSRHPTVDLIVAAIERQQATLLSTRWWFNDTIQTIPVNTDGTISVPNKTIEVVGIDCNVVPEGGKFLDLDNNTRYFTKPITVRITRQWDFEELPETAASYITYMAAIEVYTADFGVEGSLQVLQQYANDNIRLLRQSNLRNRKYNNHRKAVSRSSYFGMHSR